MIIIGIGYIALGLFVAGDVVIRRRWREDDFDLVYWLSISVLLAAAGIVHLFD